LPGMGVDAKQYQDDQQGRRPATGCDVSCIPAFVFGED
jgi:hypothetical protein